MIGDQVLPAVGRAATQLDLAGQHDVEAVAGLALVEDDVALADLDRLHLLGERLGGLRVDALEDPAAGQYLIHRRTSACALRRASTSLGAREAANGRHPSIQVSTGRPVVPAGRGLSAPPGRERPPYRSSAMDPEVSSPSMNARPRATPARSVGRPILTVTYRPLAVLLAGWVRGDGGRRDTGERLGHRRSGCSGAHRRAPCRYRAPTASTQRRTAPRRSPCRRPATSSWATRPTGCRPTAARASSTGQAVARGRPGDGQPGGAAHRGHRRPKCGRRRPARPGAQPSCFTVPGAAVVRRAPARRRVRAAEPGQQPRQRLRRRRATATPRRRWSEPGCEHTGAPDEITVVDVKGVKVAVVGFSSYAVGQQPDRHRRGAKRWSQKAAAQADLVVVQVHMGAEGSGQDPRQAGHRDVPRREPGRPDQVLPRGDRRRRRPGRSGTVRTCCAAMEFYKGRLIAYSLGNFAGGGGTLTSDGRLGWGGVLKVSLRPDGSWAGGKLISTYMNAPGMPTRDTRRARRRPGARAVRGGLRRRPARGSTTTDDRARRRLNGPRDGRVGAVAVVEPRRTLAGVNRTLAKIASTAAETELGPQAPGPPDGRGAGRDPSRRALRARLTTPAPAGRGDDPVRAGHRQAGQRGHAEALRPLPDGGRLRRRPTAPSWRS